MLSATAFAAYHDVVDELGNHLVVKLRIWKNFSLGNYATSWHIVLLSSGLPRTIRALLRIFKVRGYRLNVV